MTNLEDKAIEYLERAIDLESKEATDWNQDAIDYYLKIAQTYALLSIAQQISRVPGPKASPNYKGMGF